MTTATDLLDLQVSALLEGLAETGPVPAGGAAAAFAGAMAASLVSMAARSTSDWPEAGAFSAQALALRARLEPLALADAQAYEQALHALAGGESDGTLGRALDRAAELPLAIAEAACDVAGLAAEAAERCDARVRGETLAAVALADGAVRAACRLVEINLATVAGDERAQHAASLVEASALAWERVREA